MKKIFKYFSVFLSIALMGAFTSCNLLEPEDEVTEVVLGIKTFSPAKVVSGMEMTINGSCFDQVTEIVFPGEVSVSSFKKVTNEMIRVTVPKGVSEEGGKLVVKGEGVLAESNAALTIGKTQVSGFSKQAGEEISGGEQLTVFGTDLEFINKAEFLDADSNVLEVSDAEFYRKGTSNVILIVPRNTFEGSYVGKLYTIDGKVFPLPELSYKKPAEGGHWETVKVPVWTNEDPDGNGAVSWSGTYRFALEGHDGAGECIAEFPQDVWDKLMSQTFYLDVTATDPQIRVTNGWWDTSWKAGDLQPGNELLTDNGDGTFTATIDLSDDPDFVATLIEKHLLFTGDRFTPMTIYYTEEQWVDGGGHMEVVKTSIWKGDGSAGAVSWSGSYRFALEGHDGAGECIAEIPQDIWDKMMTETFYLDVEATDPQIRVTNGWWDTSWKVGDLQPGNEFLTDNGDGTFTATINLSDDPDFVATLIEKHLLFTGDRFTPLEIYFAEEVWVGGGGDSGPKQVPIWEGDGSAGAVSWSGSYRFALEGHDGAGECIAEIPQDTWDKMMTQTFYLDVEATDPQIRVTNGWWDTSWKVGDLQPGNEFLTDNGDGTFTATINISDDPDFIATLEEKHLLFTGDRFTPLKLYFLE